MYPDVFLKFADFRKTYGDVAALPTPAYYYGLQDKEEIHISLEEGKTLFVRLLNMTEADANGQQTAIFELNGYPRHTTVTNKLLSKNAVTKVKADPGDQLAKSERQCPAWSRASLSVSVKRSKKAKPSSPWSHEDVRRCCLTERRHRQRNLRQDQRKRREQGSAGEAGEVGSH
jgi:pyruvate carboxylase